MQSGWEQKLAKPAKVVKKAMDPRVKVETDASLKRKYSGLVEPEWQAAKAFVDVTPVNYEYSEEDHSQFALSDPPAEVITAFEAAISIG